MDGGAGFRGAKVVSEACDSCSSCGNVFSGSDCVGAYDDGSSHFLNGEAPICARGRIGAVGDVGAAELGSGGVLVDLVKPLRADATGDDAAGAICCVANGRVVRHADRGEPRFAHHLVADLVVGGEQSGGDRFPAGADGLGVFGAASTDGRFVLFVDEPCGGDGEGDDVRTVLEGGVGAVCAGGDHGTCPCFRRGVEFDEVKY